MRLDCCLEPLGYHIAGNFHEGLNLVILANLVHIFLNKVAARVTKQYSQWYYKNVICFNCLMKYTNSIIFVNNTLRKNKTIYMHKFFSEQVSIWWPAIT